MFNYIAIAHLASLAHQRFGTLQPKPQRNHHCHRSCYQNHYYRRVQIIRLPCNLIHVFTASEKIQTHKSQCGYHHHRRDLLNQPGAGWHIALTQFGVHQLQYNKKQYVYWRKPLPRHYRGKHGQDSEQPHSHRPITPQSEDCNRHAFSPLG